jgi:hypothetical protein
VGLLDLDLLSAFVLGFVVGLVHDIALYYLHIIGYGARVRGIRYEGQFAIASRMFSRGDWQEALPVVEELHSSWSNHKGALYLLIRCYDRAERWDELIAACNKYMMLHPRQDEIVEIQQMREKARRQLRPQSTEYRYS